MVACLIGGARAGAPLDAADYTAAMAEALAAKLTDRTVTVAGELELTVGRREGSQSVWLRNLYGEYRRDPSLFGEIVGVYVSALTETPGLLAEADVPDTARIVPVIKDRQWLDDNIRGLRERGVDVDFIYDDLNDELVVVYAEDTESRVRYLMSSEDIGVGRHELRALAVANLERLLPKIEMNVHEDGFARFSAGGDYEASLLLLDGIWTGGQVAVDGDIVVAVPAKDVLLVTGSENEKGLAAVRELAAEYTTEGYALTDRLFVYRDGRFRRFDQEPASLAGK
jgi:uncharacterized protein YtpQ (UPF0354 family)